MYSKYIILYYIFKMLLGVSRSRLEICSTASYSTLEFEAEA